MFHVRWRSRLRSASDTGGVPDAIAPSGRSNSGVDRIVSMRLLGRVSVSNPGKRKNVCQPIKRLLPLAPPRKSVGSPPALPSNNSAKNGPPPAPVKFARYDGRTRLWPNRYAIWNSIGIVDWVFSDG